MKTLIIKNILKATLEANKDTIFVVMTGNPSVTSSIEALRAGAWDYLPKPFSASHLQILVGRASHAVLVARETRAARSDSACVSQTPASTSTLDTTNPGGKGSRKNIHAMATVKSGWRLVMIATEAGFRCSRPQNQMT